MNFDERTEQLAISACLQYSTPPLCWKTAMHVKRGDTSLLDQVKYHFKMVYDLSIHLSFAEDDSPVFVTLDCLFHFALIELRFSELRYLDHLLVLHVIAFDLKKKPTLFVIAQSMFRTRELLHRRCASITLSDQPYKHHSEKELVRNIVKNLHYFTTLYQSTAVLKRDIDHDVWVSVAKQLGFSVSLLNRVLVLAPQKNA